MKRALDYKLLQNLWFQSYCGRSWQRSSCYQGYGRIKKIIDGLWEALVNCAEVAQRSWKLSWTEAGGRKLLAQLHGLAANCQVSPGLLDVLESFSLIVILLLPVTGEWLVLISLALLQGCLFPRAETFGQALTLPLLGLGSMILISGIISGNRDTDLTGFWQMLSWLFLAGLGGRVWRAEFVRKVLCWQIYFSLVWLVIGLWQRWQGIVTPAAWWEVAQQGMISGRIFSVFANPNIYALYLIILIGTMLPLLISVKFARVVWFHVSILVIAGLSLYWTYSRSGWLIAGVLGLWFGYRPLALRLKPLVLIGLLLVLVCLGPELGMRLNGLASLSENTLGYRIRIWHGVLVAWSEVWLWGGGSGSFDRLYSWFQPEGVKALHAHNFYLELGLEYGCLALLGFIYLIKKISSLSLNDDYALAVRAALVGLLLFGLVESWQSNVVLGGYFWLLTGFLSALAGGKAAVE